MRDSDNSVLEERSEDSERLFEAVESGFSSIQYPEAEAQLKQLIKVLGDIEDVARHIPASRGKCGMG
jgi:hypothetical protein